jgi:hypothetical protein
MPRPAASFHQSCSGDGAITRVMWTWYPKTRHAPSHRIPVSDGKRVAAARARPAGGAAGAAGNRGAGGAAGNRGAGGAAGNRGAGGATAAGGGWITALTIGTRWVPCSEPAARSNRSPAAQRAGSMCGAVLSRL